MRTAPSLTHMKGITKGAVKEKCELISGKNPIIKNSKVRNNKIRNPQKIKACIQPGLRSWSNLVWPNAIWKVVRILLRGRSKRFSFPALPKALSLGHTLKEKVMPATRTRIARVLGSKFDGIHSKAWLIYRSI